MSESSRRLAVLLALALHATTLGAQEASSEVERLRAEVARAAERASAANQAWRAHSRARTVPIETLVVSEIGLRVLATPAGLRDVEREALLAGIRGSAASLTARYGDAGRVLIDTTQWRIVFPRGLREWTDLIYLRSGRDANSTSWWLDRPLDSADVGRFLHRLAGDQLSFRSRPLGTYAGFGLTLVPTSKLYSEAYRELATSAVAPLRRCADGNLADCRRTLGTASGSEGFAQWYDPGDERTAVAFSASSLPLQDLTRRGLRTSCLAGADTACTRLLTSLEVYAPYSTLVRTSFVEYTLDAGGPATVETLLAARPDDEPLGLLARGSGIPLDTLIAGWQRALTTAATEVRTPAIPDLVVAALWGAVLLGLTGTLRKPV